MFLVEIKLASQTCSKISKSVMSFIIIKHTLSGLLRKLDRGMKNAKLKNITYSFAY